MTEQISEYDSNIEPFFQGTVGPTVADSKPWWPSAPIARTGAPNIIIIVLDDVGFAQLGSYGASIATPSIDSLAKAGLRYTNFHVTPLCSTTRACLLTGRNHHSVGVGFLSGFDTGFPSYRGAITPKAALISEMLHDNGYSTYAVGKWHLTPGSDLSPIGPFHQWPTQRGFDRYYGFLWGEDDQWAPELWYDQHRIEPPAVPGYHLSEDLVDRAEHFLRDHVSVAPERPFFLYLAFGACHAPHQAPKPFIEKYKGTFDHGWDTEREKVLQNQIALSVVPDGTHLAPPNPGVPAWNDLRPEEKRLCARLQEAFAGFMEHADTQIGRLLDFLRTNALIDNSLIILLSDNGASGEGGPFGTFNEYRYFLGLEDPIEDSLSMIDELGGPSTHNHYPSGWAQAGNTPLKLYKKYTFGGGVRAPLIVHWPNQIQTSGEFRRQFHHVIDIVPTILEVAGVQALTHYRGIKQLPVHGSSMLYSFSAPEEPTTHPIQYFEMIGNRGIIHDHWKAVTYHEPGHSYDEDRWELYNLESDFSESSDCAAEHPKLLAELRAEWWREAQYYGVLPLDDRMQKRDDARDPASEKFHYELLSGSRIPSNLVGPNFNNRSFRISAQLLRTDSTAEGVLFAYGRHAAGFSLFIQDNRLKLDYNLAGNHILLESPESLSTGEITTDLIVRKLENRVTATLTLNERVLVEGTLPRAMPSGFSFLTSQCGHNSPSAVSDHYQPPYEFSGTLHRVIIDLAPHESIERDDALSKQLAQD